MQKNEQGDENCHTSLSQTRWVLVLKVAVNSEWISYTWLVKYNCSSNSQSGFLKHDTITTVTNLIDNCNKTLSHVKSQVCDCLNIPAILIKNFTFKIQVIVPQKLAEIDIFDRKTANTLLLPLSGNDTQPRTLRTSVAFHHNFQDLRWAKDLRGHDLAFVSYLLTTKCMRCLLTCYLKAVHRRAGQWPPHSLAKIASVVYTTYLQPI